MRPRAWILAVALAVVAVAVLIAAGQPGSAYRHRDFLGFWAASRLLIEGGDPYNAAEFTVIVEREATAPLLPLPPPVRHIYPLWTVIALVPLAALPFDVATAVWVVAQIGVVALALHALARLFDLTRADRVVLFGFAAAFQPLWLLAAGGNITGFVLGAYVAALAAVGRRPAAAGGLLSVLAMKPHPFIVAAPAILLAAPARDRVRILVGGTIGLALLVASTLPFGAGWIPAWIDAALGQQLQPTGSNATVWTLGRVLPLPGIAPLLALAAILALAGWWRTSGAPARTLVAGAVPVSLFVAPHGWSYDQVLLLVTLAAILAELSALRGTLRTVALILVAAVAVPLPWSLYAAAFAAGGEERSALTPLVFFALLVAARAAGWRSTRTRRRSP